MITDSNLEVAKRRETWREEAALRRIATLVAEGVQPHELFAVVAEEVGGVVGVPSVGVARFESDGTATICGTFPPEKPLFRTGRRVSLEGANVLSMIRESGEPARIDDYAGLEGEVADAVRRNELCSSVGVPIVAGGGVWGAIVTSGAERLPENTGARLAGVVGVSKSVEAVPLGSRFPPDDLFAPTRVLRTARSARISENDLASAGGAVAGYLRHHGYLSQVASPIVVDGHLWGAISVNSTNDLPPDTEERLGRFTELVATAIANAESRRTLAQLADEKAALRRVATIVAKEDLPEKVFAKVAEETGRLLGGVECTLLRNELDGAVTNVGTWGKIAAVFPLGTRSSPGGDGVAATVLRTGHPHRIDDYSAVADPIARSARDRGIESSVGCPILVRGAITCRDSERVGGLAELAELQPVR